MRILIVTQYYFPEQFLINDIAVEFVKRGNQVTVVTGLPNYNSRKCMKEYKWFRKRHEVLDGVDIYRCFETDRRQSAIGYGLNYGSYALSASIRVLMMQKKYDIVYCYQMTPITLAIPAVIYKKLHQGKLFLYCLDLYPESVKSHISHKGVIYWFFEKISRYIYSRCDYIAVTSKPFISYLHENNGITLDRMGYLPQHGNGDMLNMNLAGIDNDCADFMFAGNIGFAQQLDVVVYAASLLDKKLSYRIHIVGNGSKLYSIQELVKKYGLEDKFIFYGRVSGSEMADYYRKADALLLTLQGDDHVGDTMPGKLPTYMTTGKPIFAAVNGAAYETIQEADCGKAVKAGDYEGLASLMEDFIRHSEKYKYCGENGKTYFKRHFTFQKHMDDCCRILKWLADEV